MEGTPAIIRLADGRLAVLYRDGTIIVIERDGSISVSTSQMRQDIDVQMPRT